MILPARARRDAPPGVGHDGCVADDTDLERAEQVYRRLAMVDLGADTFFAHHLAYLRTAASPRIAALLAHTGHVEHASLERATDTGLLIYSVIHHGLDSPQGQGLVAALNTMHGRWRIANEDFLWVLGTFVVPTTRFLDRFAWRATTAEEREATATWFCALGERMGLTALPTCYADFEAVVDDYEAAELAPSAAADRLFAASLPLLAAVLPAALRPRARTLLGVLFEPGVRAALRLPTPPRAVAAAVGLGMLARSLRSRPAPGAGPSFVPGAPVPAYPDGWSLDDLGVDVAVLRPPAR